MGIFLSAVIWDSFTNYFWCSSWRNYLCDSFKIRFYIFWGCFYGACPGILCGISSGILRELIRDATKIFLGFYKEFYLRFLQATLSMIPRATSTEIPLSILSGIPTRVSFLFFSAIHFSTSRIIIVFHQEFHLNFSKDLFFFQIFYKGYSTKPTENFFSFFSRISIKLPPKNHLEIPPRIPPNVSRIFFIKNSFQDYFKKFTEEPFPRIFQSFS